jgi:hypothetical protein
MLNLILTLACRTMELSWIVGGIVVVVAIFFAYQWFTLASKKPKARAVKLAGTPTQNQRPVEPLEDYPVVAGQTENDLRQKEPTQRPAPPSNQEAVTQDGKGPANFKENLRRPEQSFHEPSGEAPTLSVSDVPAGRAVEPSAQGFSPELAQNDGPIVGNNVFAFDGMEPTNFANF